MLCYKGRTYCADWAGCEAAYSDTCHYPLLTPEVEQAAEEAGLGDKMCQVCKPVCFRDGDPDQVIVD